MGKTKEQLNMRIAKEKLDIFKSLADSRGLSQIEYFEEMVNNSAQGRTIEGLVEQLESVRQQLQEKQVIIVRMEKKYGESPTLEMRRVTFSVTNEQFQSIDDLAHKLKCPKKYLMSRHFFKSNTKQQPVLTI